MEEIYEKLAEILEVDEITPTDKFEDFEEWDSLTTLSIISMLDSDYDVPVSADQVNKFVCVNDLLEYIKINNVDFG